MLRAETVLDVLYEDRHVIKNDVGVSGGG